MSKLSQLEGQVLTLLDASIADKEQREAAKSIFRRMWWDWVQREDVVSVNCTNGCLVKHDGECESSEVSK